MDVTRRRRCRAACGVARTTKGLRPQRHCLTLGLARAHSSVRRNARSCHRHRESLTRRWLDDAVLGTRPTPRVRLDSPSRRSTPGGGLGCARCRPRYPPRCRHTSLDRRGGGAAADRPAAGSDLTCGGPPGRARRSVDRSSLCRRRATAGKCALARRATSRAHHHVVRAVPAYPLGADGHVHCPTAARVRQGARQGCGCVRSRCSVAGRAGRTGRAVDRRGHRRSCAARAVRHQRRVRAGPRAARTRHRRRNRCRGPTRDACRRVQCALHDRGLPEPLPARGAGQPSM